MKVYILYLVTC